jgi:hypothetical protein
MNKKENCMGLWMRCVWLSLSFFLLAPFLRGAERDVQLELNSHENLQLLHRSCKKDLGDAFPLLSHFYFAKNSSGEEFFVIYMKKDVEFHSIKTEVEKQHLVTKFYDYWLHATLPAKIHASPISLEVLSYPDSKNESDPHRRMPLGHPELQNPTDWSQYVSARKSWFRIGF